MLKCQSRLSLIAAAATVAVLGLPAIRVPMSPISKQPAAREIPSMPASAMATVPNGVAAGDTTQTSTVLWARGTTVGPVLFECSTDPAFSTDLLTATVTVTDVLQPVKVQVTGLSPATTYYHRVTDAAGASAGGRFRTAVAGGTHAGLRFGASGDWSALLAPYPAIANADACDLDFFIELGDTIVAEFPSPAATTLGEFRLRHNEVYSSHLGLNTWAELRASTSVLATIDDNEVRNNFAGGAAPSSDPRFGDAGAFINETELYGNALQAFQEYNPLRDEYYGATGDPRTANKRRLYRFNTYGGDAATFVLDTRSFRDEPLPLEDPTDLFRVLAFLANSLNDTSRTLLGAQQLADLKAGLQQAQADGITWKFVCVSGPIQNLGVYLAPDRYEGYAAERSDLLRFINQSGIENVVFIAASLHGTVVNNLTYQETLGGAQIPTGAFEVIVGPVAIDPPFGPAVVGLAEYYELITPEERAAYDAMSRDEKDEFVRQLIDEELLAPLEYDRVGLDGSGIEAHLLQGGYVAAHTYGWTEFEIGRGPQVLTVTTWGIAPYTGAELTADPTDVIARTPAVVSRFVVIPGKAITPLNAITIEGPTTGTISTTCAFTATVSPVSATTPVTYVWQASDQVPVTQTNHLSDTAGFSWAITGTKTVTVSAQNGGPSVSNTRTITITPGLVGEKTVYLPLVLRDG
jgi:phosphodiesterase/alkaline phosphatase D-like protein